MEVGGSYYHQTNDNPSPRDLETQQSPDMFDERLPIMLDDSGFHALDSLCRPLVEAFILAGQCEYGPNDFKSCFLRAVERCADREFNSILLEELESIPTPPGSPRSHEIAIANQALKVAQEVEFCMSIIEREDDSLQYYGSYDWYYPQGLEDQFITTEPDGVHHASVWPFLQIYRASKSKSEVVVISGIELFRGAAKAFGTNHPVAEFLRRQYELSAIGYERHPTLSFVPYSSTIDTKIRPRYWLHPGSLPRPRSPISSWTPFTLHQPYSIRQDWVKAFRWAAGNRIRKYTKPYSKLPAVRKLKRDSWSGFNALRDLSAVSTNPLHPKLSKIFTKEDCPGKSGIPTFYALSPRPSRSRKRLLAFANR
ncbi:hypothetical protein ABW19_dt0203734 [Dactylella cylindrospora]|nr:hypothetical protein ABW19_dt0203734 [Dactylella cylindrospora]